MAEALELGLGEKALRSDVVRAPFRGVRVPRTVPDTLAVRCLAAGLLLAPAAAFDGATAAQLRRLPLHRSVDPAHPLVVRVPDAASRTRLVGVRSRVGTCPPVRPSPDPTTHLRVVPDTEAWAALATDGYPADELVVVGDAIARRRGGLGDLRQTVGSYRARRGVRRMADALDRVRERVDSPQETRTRLLVVAAGIPEPEVNVDVLDADGGWLCRPDLSWPQVRVALEYDGDDHLRRDRRRKDLARREALDRAGWRIVVALAEDLSTYRARLVRRVEDALHDQGLRW